MYCSRGPTRARKKHFPLLAIQTLGGKKMILIVIDLLSKWIEAFPTKWSTSATVVIELSRTSFAKFGVPEVEVTNNVICATSPFYKWFGRTCYSNCETRFKKKENERSMKTRLAKVMMAYLVLPQSTTGESSAL